MKKKSWLIAAASLILIGCIIFTGVMTMLGWNFKKLSTVKYETNTYEISEPFSSISVDTDTADITFAPSTDGKCRVECVEETNTKHTVIAEDDTLIVKVIKDKPWHAYIGINLGSPKITVSLPEAEYASLCINESTGNIDLKNISAGTIDLSLTTGNVSAADVNCSGNYSIKLTTGKVSLSDVNCRNLVARSTTGDMSLKNVIAAKEFQIKARTGDVKFDGCDASEISVETTTGDIAGNLRTEKIFIAEATTGDVSVPDTASGGICRAKVTTGDIKLDIQENPHA